MIGLAVRLVFSIVLLCTWPLRALLWALFRPRGGCVEIEIGGAVRATPGVTPFWDFRPSGPSLLQLGRRVRRLARDPSVRTVLVRIRSLNAGYATCGSLRGYLLDLVAADKRVVAYLPDGGGNREAFVASAANQIFLAPQSSLALVGLLAEATFYAEAFERFGVSAQVEAIGEYKSAGDALRRTSMSKENREQIDLILDAQYAALLDAVGKGRRRSAEEARAWIDAGPYRAERAVEAGLTDGVAYEDELSRIVSSTDKPARILRWEAYRRRRVPRFALAFGRRPRIALVDVRGLIVDRGGAFRALAAADRIVPTLRLARADRSVRAVVLCIDSRGGSGLASDRIWREVSRLREKKPVVAWMGDVAASGGYYVAAAADRIVAQSLGITGSIGVIAAKVSVGGALEKVGVRRESLRRGKRAGMLSGASPLSPDELGALREEVAGFYEDFVARVASGRGRERPEIEANARGRVFVAEEALRRGLIDEVGTLERAIAIARQRGGPRAVRAEPTPYALFRPRRVPPPEPPARAPAALALLRALGDRGGLAEIASLLSAERILAVLPFDLTIR